MPSALRCFSIRTTLFALMCGLLFLNGLPTFGKGALACPTDVQGSVLEEYDDDGFDGVHGEGAANAFPITLTPCLSSKPLASRDTASPRTLHLTGPPYA